MAAIHGDGFKRDTVRIAIASGLTRRQVAADLETGLSTRGNWGRAVSEEARLPAQNAGLLRGHLGFAKRAASSGRRGKYQKRQRCSSGPKAVKFQCIAEYRGTLTCSGPIEVVVLKDRVKINSRVSEGIRQWRDKAKLSETLRLQDARGTAATRQLDAGLTLAQIASFMGWGLRHVQNVIENYARIAPGESDTVLGALTVSKRGGA